MTKQKFFLILNLLCITSFCKIVVAQEYDARTTPIATGQGSNLITNHLLKDRNGFLWYSIRDGIIKKMGNHNIFYPFNHPLIEETAFRLQLIETRKGFILGTTEYGVFTLNPNTGILKWVFTPTIPETSIFVEFISPIEDDKGNIWMGTNTNSIYCYTLDDKILSYKFANASIYSEARRLVIVKDILDDGSIIFKQTHKKLKSDEEIAVWHRYFNGEAKQLLEIEEKYYNGNKILISEISDNGIFFPKNKSGAYWLNNKQYNYVYVPEVNKQIFYFPYSELKIIKPSKIESNNKLRIIGRNKTKLDFFEADTINNTFDLKNEFSFKNAIRNFIVDSDNTVWANTIDGITSIHPFKKPFTKFEFIEDDDDYLEKNISCRGIEKTSNGNIYVFTYHGWFELKKGENTFKEINFKHEKTGEPITHSLYSFYKQNDSIFWAYGYTPNIYKLDVVKKTFTIFTRNNDFSSGHNTTNDIEPLSENTLLLAGTFGLSEFDLVTHQFKDVSQLNDSINLKNKYIHEIYLDKSKNELWLGLLDNEGLYKKNLTTGLVTHYYEGSKKTPLINNNIHVLTPDTENIVWIGTEKGLQKINTKTLETKTYTVKDGFKNDVIANIIPTEDYLWVGTYNGLVRLNKETESTNVYFETDGLPNNEFNKKSFLKASKDSLFFGGITGLVGFNPNSVEYEDERSEIFLAEVNFHDEELETNKTQHSNLQSITSFIIPYAHNYLNLKFAINDIIYLEKNTYRYKIEGLSEDWTSIGHTDELQLQGIIPGNYKIKIQGYNSNGKASNILTYDLKVEQVFYKKAWFILLCLLVLIGLFLIWHLYRRQIIKEQYELQHKFDVLETKALRAQMNPHFIFNALNGIQSVMMLEGEAAANKYLASFSKLLRLTLDINHAEYISIKHEVEYLTSYMNLEELRLGHKLNYKIEVGENVNVNDMYIPCMLFQPIVENAIIHGLAPKKENRDLKVLFKFEGDTLIGEVIDNGIGREAALIRKKTHKQKHKSWATHIMSQRINISNTLNKKKIIFNIIDLKKDDKPLGTKVVLKIPIKWNK